MAKYQISGEWTDAERTLVVRGWAEFQQAVLSSTELGILEAWRLIQESAQAILYVLNMPAEFLNMNAQSAIGRLKDYELVL